MLYTAYIYCHTSPSGKQYIGQTFQEPTKRWGNGIKYKQQPIFWSAIQKYGWKSFEHSILHKLQSNNLDTLKTTINQLECDEIEKCNTLFPNGYNQTRGGESLYGDCNPMYGKKHSQRTKQKISDTKRQYFKDNPDKKPYGAKNPQYKAIPDEEILNARTYSQVMGLAKKYNVNERTIRRKKDKILERGKI